jgi:hypothetical protein
MALPRRGLLIATAQEINAVSGNQLLSIAAIVRESLEILEKTLWFDDRSRLMLPSRDAGVVSIRRPPQYRVLA